MRICLKRLDLAPNIGSTWIVKVIDTNLYTVGFVRFFERLSASAESIKMRAWLSNASF